MLQLMNLFSPRKIPVIGYGGLYYQGDRRASGMKGRGKPDLLEYKGYIQTKNPKSSLIPKIDELLTLYDSGELTVDEINNLNDETTKNKLYEIVEDNKRKDKLKKIYLNYSARIDNLKEAQAKGKEIQNIKANSNLITVNSKKEKKKNNDFSDEELDRQLTSINTMPDIKGQLKKEIIEWKNKNSNFWDLWKDDNDISVKKTISFPMILGSIEMFFNNRKLNPIIKKEDGKDIFKYNTRGDVFEVWFNYVFKSLRDKIPELKNYTKAYNANNPITYEKKFIEKVSETNYKYYPLDNVLVTDLRKNNKDYAMAELKLYSFLKDYKGKKAENTNDNYYLQVTKFVGFKNKNCKFIPLYMTINNNKQLRLYNIICIENRKANYTLPNNPNGYPIYIFAGLIDGIYLYDLTNDFGNNGIKITQIKIDQKTFLDQYDLDESSLDENNVLYNLDTGINDRFFINRDEIFSKSNEFSSDRSTYGNIINRRIKINKDKLKKIIS